MVTIKRENWNGKYVYVVREGTKITSYKYAKGKNLSLSRVQQQYKKSNTLNNKITYVERFKNGTKLEFSDKKTNKTSQYYVSKKVTVDGKQRTLYGFSNKGGTRLEAMKHLKGQLRQLDIIKNYRKGDFNFKTDKEGYSTWKVKAK